MLPIIKKISSFNHSSGNDIKYIVLHDTGNFKDTAVGNATYFCTADRQSSAHYFVDEISIYQVVEDSEGSWHCGDGGMLYNIGNHNSIGIEMCNSGGFISEITINNTIELVKYLMAKYNVGIDNVVRHYDASRKICPHNMSDNNWSKWSDFKNRLKGTTPAVKPAPQVEVVQMNGVNAICINDTLYARDSKGNRVYGYVDKGDKIQVLDVSYTKQLALVKYPTASGQKIAYVSNIPFNPSTSTGIIKYNSYYNGVATDKGAIVYDKINGAKIGTLNAYEKATIIGITNGWYNVVYDTDKGFHTKSGWIKQAEFKKI